MQINRGWTIRKLTAIKSHNSEVWLLEQHFCDFILKKNEEWSYEKEGDDFINELGYSDLY